MAIRLVNATIWQRDWFLNLDGKHQLFVHYLRDHCDHAGVWQPSFKLFEKISGMRIFKDEFLSNVNQDSIRVHILENGKWWLTGFIEDQYKTLSLNSFNSAHRGVIFQLENNQVPYESYGYKVAPSKPLASPYEGAKDKDKDKDISNIQKEGSGEKTNQPKMETIEFPSNLKSSAFQDAWDKWIQCRVEQKKPLKPTAIKMQLDKLSKMGEIRAIATIENSIAGQYQGLFEPRDENKDKPKQQRYTGGA
jgi:hypothetical protein